MIHDNDVERLKLYSSGKRADICHWSQELSSESTKSWVCSGPGGMGRVYRARDTPPGTGRWRIKILPPEFRDDRVPYAGARFEREARLLAALNHPHIAHDPRSRGGRRRDQALVMELVEGVTPRRLRLAQAPLAAPA